MLMMMMMMIVDVDDDAVLNSSDRLDRSDTISLLWLSMISNK